MKKTPRKIAGAYVLRAVAGAMLLSSAAALAVVLSLHAANTIAVTNTNDSGPGSLRQALAGANDGDTIYFDAALNGQTITLTSGQLNVDKSATISGRGADRLTITTAATSRIFQIFPGTTVTISGLSITNGSAGRFIAGGIFNDHATLTISDCTLSDNSAFYGGAIYNNAQSGTATLT